MNDVDLPYVTVTSPSLDDVCQSSKSSNSITDIVSGGESTFDGGKVERPSHLSYPSTPTHAPADLSPTLSHRLYDSDSSWVSHVTADSAVQERKPVSPRNVRKKLQRMKMKLGRKSSLPDISLDAGKPPHSPTQQKGAEDKNSSGETPEMQPLLNGVKKKKKKSGSKAKRLYKNALKKTSEIQVLNPTYKQKNVDFHKFFKKLPETERLIVDHSCALMKDILVQGRLYVSQNYVCFHSNILKWQTAVTIGFKDIVCLTKEKTVKVFPNAIQFQVKGRNKFTFTSFTSRDRAHYQINRLWQNALMDKPMTPHQLWNSVRKHYGSDLGCSSDDDYVRPTNVFDYGIDSGTPTDEIYKFGTTNKVPRTTQGRYEGGDVIDGEGAGPQVSISDPSSEDGDKSLSGCSMEDDDVINMRMDVIDDDDEAEYSAPSFKRTYLVRQYDCSAAELFDVIYGDDCDFWRQYLKKRETFDITIDRWSEGSGEYEGHRVRNMNYNLTLNNPLGPKSSNVDELQVWYNHSEHDRQYTVDCTAHTHGVPYSDYFRTVMRYQIRKLTQTTSELRVSAKLVFNKTPWGLVKNFIEKNCYSGLEENFQMLEPELNAFVSEMNASKRRESESPNRDFPRQRLSISSGDGIRRRDKKSSSGDSPTENHDIRNGDVIHTNHVTGADDVINSPISSAPATPLHDVNNNNSKHVEQRSVTRGGKSSLKVVAFVVFALLVVSNYSLYLRVASLERLHSMQGNDVMMTLHPDSHQEPPVTATDSIEHRLLRFENLLQNHVTSLEGRWRKLNADWLELRSMMNQILEQSSKSTVKT